MTNIRAQSLLDPTKHITNDTWCITQVAAGPSMANKIKFRGKEYTFNLICCARFDPGHASLIIEKDSEEKDLYEAFDYKEIPDKKGYARLDKKFISTVSMVEGDEQYKKYFKDLPPERKKTWECKKSAARNLVAALHGECKLQANNSKSYSVFWENCHFLIAEHLKTHQEELGIDDLFEQEYIKKFHLGGWRYSLLFSMPTSIMFATVLPSLFSIFEWLAKKSIQVNLINSEAKVERSISFNSTVGLQHLSLAGAEYLALPMLLIYSINLIVTFCTSLFECNFTRCKQLDSKHTIIRPATALYGVFSSLLLAGFSFLAQAFLSPINKDWWWGWRMFEEMLSPLLGLAGFILSNLVLFYCCRYPERLNQEQCMQVSELMKKSKDDRANDLNVHFGTSIISVCGMLAKAFSRPIINSSYLHMYTSAIAPGIFFVPYPLGCLFGCLCCWLPCRLQSNDTNNTTHNDYSLLFAFFKPVVIFLGLFTPSFVFIRDKIHFIRDHHLNIQIKDFPMLTTLNISDSSINDVCESIERYGNQESQQLCNSALHYLTKTELAKLGGYSIISYGAAIFIIWAMNKVCMKVTVRESFEEERKCQPQPPSYSLSGETSDEESDQTSLLLQQKGQLDPSIQKKLPDNKITSYCCFFPQLRSAATGNNRTQDRKSEPRCAVM